MTPKLLFSLSFLVFAVTGHATETDARLQKYIQQFNMRAMDEKLSPSHSPKYNLGKILFETKLISGNKNISCRTCHDPAKGTSDGLALSQTHDGRGVLKRNSLSLFNTGLKNSVHMFWDGRVSFNPETKTFITPEPRFNGANPSASAITKVMTSALAMQAIFPILSREEMRGAAGENEVANESDNLKAWDLVVERLRKNPELKNRFAEAFPEISSGSAGEKITIGHVGEALSHFIREEFYSDGSPFNRYLKGELNAMTDSQKEGMRIFVERGRCVACHDGGQLGDHTFYQSVGAPQLGARPAALDKGRADVTGLQSDTMLFRVPTLLNLKLTAPYMHNGAYETIRDVINHYSEPRSFLEAFDINLDRSMTFPVEIEVKNSPRDIAQIFQTIQTPFLREGLHFTEEEKDYLEDFLANALTDPKWLPLDFFKKQKVE